MARPEEIQRIVARLDGPARVFAFREIQYLPDLLHENESLGAIVGGLYLGKQGLLIATDQRAVFFDRGLLYRVHIEEFPYRSISSIQHKKGLVFGEVQICSGGNRAVISQIVKDQLDNFLYVLNNLRNVAGSSAAPSTSSSVSVTLEQSSAVDFVDEIGRLGTLKAAGLLDEEEFQAAKRKLLGLADNVEAISQSSDAMPFTPAVEVMPQLAELPSWASEQMFERYRSPVQENAGGGFGKRRSTNT